MTEIPEHLLNRSKAAKAAAKGGSKDAPAASTGDATPVAAATPAESLPTESVPTESLPNLDPEPEPAEPEPVYVTASKRRTRIPVWALPVVAALPVWAISFAGTMQQPDVEDPLFVESTLFYSDAGCSGCHGAAGGGGTGYGLANGSVLETFPNPIDQMVHVARGSAAILDESYGGERADGRRVSGALGQMPAQAGQISLVELELIVFHERATLSGEDTSTPGYGEWMDHMREAFEAGDEEPINLDLLLACADPAITPGATGVGSGDEDQPCPGPAGFADDEEAALAE